MFRLIVEKELREIIGTTKFAVTFGVCAVLILLAFYAGARNYQVARAQHDAAVVENLRQMEGLTDWMRVDNHRVFLPPQPIAALVSGVSNDVGRTVQVEAVGELTAVDSFFSEDPLFAVFRFLDLEFIFTVVLSLFAILFGYDAVNGEKERGTLRLTFAHAVPRDSYILGKLTGASLAIGLPLLVPLLLGCLLLPLLGVPMDGASWARLGLVILSGLLYFGVFLTLSVLVSALTERSSNSFLVLLVAWILLVLILPRSAVLLGGRAVDVPNIDEINSRKSAFRSQLWDEDREAMASFEPSGTGDAQEVMQEFQRFMGELSEERNEKMQAFTDRLNEERTNRQRVRQRVSFGLARLSPAAVFSLASTRLAGTSAGLREHFLEAATAYQASYARFMQEKTGMQHGGGLRIMIRDEDEEEPEPIDPNELPVFDYDPPTLEATASAALPDMGLLVLFNLVFFAAAFAAFLRYDVR